MSLPKTTTEPPAPLEPTCAHQGDEPAPLQPARWFRVALVTGSPAQPTYELEAQLRKRLRFGAIVVTAYCAGQLVIGLPFDLHRLLASPLEAFTHPPRYGLVLLIGCLEGFVAYRLSSRWPADLARLRALEWIVAAPVVVYTAWSGATHLAGSLTEVENDPWKYAYAASTAWGLMVVGYGVLIPNTWYRCAAVVGLIALSGCLPDVFVLLGHGVPSQPALQYLTTRVLWLSVAVAIAVYGSYRIEVLRRTALEARKLGQYLLKERLGAGGMGEVHLAEHVLLRRPCAIKLIRPERAGDPRNLLRFEREVQTTATLTHPNTVQIYDYGHAEDGTFYYVMEYLPGLTLSQLVKQHGPLPAARAVHFLRQVCGALREAHAVGLIHRDIKPANMMVCERGGVHDVAKLLDFGLVMAQGIGQDTERLTEECAIAGTPAYVSPEQASGKEDLDARSDIYSVGCVAYFLLTGQPPFAGRTAVRMLAAHMYEPPAPPITHRPDVPADIERVVLRCLAKDPAKRYPSAQSLENALAGCLTVGRWTEDDATAWWRGNRVQTMGAYADA